MGKKEDEEEARKAFSAKRRASADRVSVWIRLSLAETAKRALARPQPKPDPEELRKAQEKFTKTKAAFKKLDSNPQGLTEGEKRLMREARAEGNIEIYL